MFPDGLGGKFIINYQKPEIKKSSIEVLETVNTASGEIGRKCQSVYMKGVYHPTNYSNGADMMSRGCEGCNANWGYCGVSACNYDGVFKPSWEVAGVNTDNKWNTNGW